MAQKWLFRRVQIEVGGLRDLVLQQCLIALLTNPFYVLWNCRHLKLQYWCSIRILTIAFRLETEDSWNKCTSLTNHRNLCGFHLCFSSFLLKLPKPFGVSETKKLLKIVVAKWYCLHNSYLNQLLAKRLICLWALLSMGPSFYLWFS